MIDSGPFYGALIVALACFAGWWRSSIANRWLRAEVAVLQRQTGATPDAVDVAIAVKVIECEEPPG